MGRHRHRCWFFLVALLVWLWPWVAQGVPREGNSREARGEGWVLDHEAVLQILETHFQRMIPDPKKRVEIKDLRGFETVVLPQGKLTHEVVLPEQAYRGGPLSPTIILSINGQEKKRLRLSVRVDVYADVVVATRFLPKHSEIRERDVQWVNRNIALLPNDVVTEMKDVLDYRTTLSVNGLEVLRKGMVEVPPLVRRGDLVIMTIEKRGFKITAWGEVRDEGRRGERVKLVNLTSRKEVFGRVLDPNTVVIDY